MHPQTQIPTHTRTQTCVHLLSPKHMYVCISLCFHISLCIYTYTCAHTSQCVYTSVYPFMQKYACARVRVHCGLRVCCQISYYRFARPDLKPRMLGLLSQSLFVYFPLLAIVSVLCVRARPSKTDRLESRQMNFGSTRRQQEIHETQQENKKKQYFVVRCCVIAYVFCACASDETFPVSITDEHGVENHARWWCVCVWEIVQLNGYLWA